jgi:hypothetical protein
VIGNRTILLEKLRVKPDIEAEPFCYILDVPIFIGYYVLLILVVEFMFWRLHILELF